MFRVRRFMRKAFFWTQKYDDRKLPRLLPRSVTFTRMKSSPFIGSSEFVQGVIAVLAPFLLFILAEYSGYRDYDRT